MTMQITMKQTRYGAGGALLNAGSTYSVTEAIGAELVGKGFATDVAGALQPGRSVPVMAENNPLTGESVKTMYQCTQAQYDAIAVKDANTLYIIVG